jgi:hypothetical protein
MAEHALECGALFLTASYGIGEGNTNQEREGWLNRVMKAHADPLGVSLIEGKNPPNDAVGEGKSDAGELEHLRHHEQHDKASIGVHCNVSLQFLLHAHDGFADSHWLRCDHLSLLGLAKQRTRHLS